MAPQLAPYLPGDAAEIDAESGADSKRVEAVSQAFFGSAGVLPISWMYIAMTGGEGLRSTAQVAVLNANYLAKKLNDFFPVLYTGPSGLVAHECILDLRPMTQSSGITAEDVCKRLIDFGFHAPTLAFPVAGTLMVEPTESEDLEELDRFIEAMAQIHAEMTDVAEGRAKAETSVLRMAPHTAEVLTADEWDREYSRASAGYPFARLRRAKYWVPVGRIDGAAGDRNFVCECPPIEAFDIEVDESAAE